MVRVRITRESRFGSCEYASERTESIGRVEQRGADAGFALRMTGIGDDAIFGLRPVSRQFIGAADRADEVVATLHDDRRDLPDPIDVIEQIVLRQEDVVAEV